MERSKYVLIMHINGVKTEAPFFKGDEGQVIFEQGVLGEALKKMMAASESGGIYQVPLGIEWRYR